MQPRGPSPPVVAAFGLAGAPVPLPGGQGRAFAVGAGIMKPSEDAAADEWIAGLVADLTPDGFRVARPLRAAGRYVVDGWTAWERVAGEHWLRGCPWARAVEVAGRFTTALSAVDRPLPPFRETVWRIADRMAWDETPAEWTGPGRGALDQLQAGKEPVLGEPQLVHGDMAGNLLWHPGRAPAVIDVSPYRRPAGWAVAVVVVDAVLWYGAEARLADAGAHLVDFDQLLLRALMFRLVTSDLLLRRRGVDRSTGGWSGESQVRRDLDHARPLLDRLRTR